MVLLWTELRKLEEWYGLHFKDLTAKIIDDTILIWHEYDTSRQNFINQQRGI